jgi:hypothetical protein
MVSLSAVEEALHRLYIGATGTVLRKEDRKKAIEVVGILSELERLVPKAKHKSPIHVIDAAAGKAYVGLMAAEFVLSPKARVGQITLIEREVDRAKACCQAVSRVQSKDVTFTVLHADVADSRVWPVEPDIVVALHACGPAWDTIAERAMACRARHLLLVPCCTSEGVAAAVLAGKQAEALGLPRHAEVRRRFIQALVDAQRTLRLEAAGYATDVVAFVPPTITPHNLLWRARRTGEAVRMAEAAEKLKRIQLG